VSAHSRRFRGPTGKVVDFIQVSFHEDHKCVSVYFKDKTCFALTLRVDVSPHIVGLYDMASGDSKIIREYVLPKAFR
jgi:hypothetical protein